MTIYIGGMGLAYPLGVDLHAVYEKLRQGQSAIVELDNYQRRGRKTSVAKCDKALITAKLEEMGISPSLYDELPSVALALIATFQAVKNATIPIDFSRCGLFASSSLFNANYLHQNYEKYFKGERPSIKCSVYGMPNFMAGKVAEYFKITGLVNTISSSCASTMQSISFAMRELESHAIDTAIILSSDSAINQSYLDNWMDIRLLATSNVGGLASRPFCKTRDGFVSGEGAAAIILTREKTSHSLSFPEHVFEGNNDLGISEESVVELLARFHKKYTCDAPLAFLHSSAGGSLYGDREEGRGIIRSPFQNLPIYASKALVGNSMASSALIGIVHSALILEGGVVPSNYHYFDVDETFESQLQFHTVEVPCQSQSALVLTTGFGGVASALSLHRHL